MAGYIRQSSFIDGDTITAALFNNEYNQLVNAFSNTSGHKHDGTTAEGPVIGLIGDAGETSPNNKVLIDTTNNYIEFYVEVSSAPVQQLYIADGAIIPVTDNDIDLGTSSLEFKDIYIDGTATIDTLTVDEAATVGTTLGVTGATTLSSTLGVTGATTLSSTLAVTGATTLSSTLAVTGTSTLTGNVTATNDLSVGGNLTVTGNATISGNLTFGDADTDSINLSAEIDSNIVPNTDDTYDLGTSTKQWRNLYIDGTAEIDTLAIDGTTVTSTAAELNILDGVTSTAAELNILDGVTSTTAELNILDGVTATATEINLLDGVTSTTAELNILDGVTATATEINLLDGVTATTAELNILDGVTSNATELNLLDGITEIDTDISTVAATDTTLASAKAIKTYVDSQVTAQDLDFQGDTGGALSIDLDSESLTIAGGTGIDTSGATNTLTVAIDSTVATLTGSQTLTNKTLTTPVISSISNTGTLTLPTSTDTLVGRATTDTLTNKTLTSPVLNTGVSGTAFLDDDTFATATASTLASSESIKAYVDTEVGAIVTDVVSDTTPQLGGDLDLNSNDITGTGNINITGTIQSSGNITGTLATAAQPNITSVGTLTGLDVAGTPTFDGLTVDGNNDIQINRDGVSTAKIFWDRSGTTDAKIELAADENLSIGVDEAQLGGKSLIFRNNATEAMRIDSSGNVGIGTSSPSATFHVNSGTNNVGAIFESTDQEVLLALDDSLKTTTIESNNGILIFGTNGASGGTSATEAMRIDRSGNVGIGTSPVSRLTYSGSFDATSAGSKPSLTGAGSYGGGIGFIDTNVAGMYTDSSGGNLKFFTNQSGSDTAASKVAMTIDSSGNVGIGTSSPSYKLDVWDTGGGNIASFTNGVNADLRINCTSGVTLLTPSTGTLAFGTSSTERMRIDNSGNLLIGTTTKIGGQSSGVQATVFAAEGALQSHETSKLIMQYSSNVGRLRSYGATAGTGEIALHTGGGGSSSDTERMRIDASGNVGIGTSSPSYPFHVTGSGDTVAAVTAGASSIAALNLGNSTNLADGGIRYDNSADALILRAANAEKMRIDSSGNVGIGTNSPAHKLDVQHTITSGGYDAIAAFGTSGSGTWANSAHQVIVGGPNVLGYTGLIIYSDSTSGIGQLSFADGRGANDSWRGSVSYNHSSNHMQFNTNASERMRIDSSGKVLINNTDSSPRGYLNLRGAVANNVTTLLSFDDMGIRGTGTAQAIDFIMGRTGFISEDACASLRGVCEADSSTSVSHKIGYEFHTGVGTGQHMFMRLRASSSIMQLHTDEVPTYGNPPVSNSIVLGPTTATGLINGGLTNGTALYNKSGELYATDSSHNNTQLTPHNWTLIPDGPSEELAWTYWSQRPSPDNKEITQSINVDIAKVVRKVEDLVGEKLIYTENSNMDDHTYQNIIADIQSTLADLTTRIEALEG